MVNVSDLRKQLLFENIDDETLGKISQKIQDLSFKEGAHVFREKDDTKGIYLIHSGKFEITKTTPDGWKQTLAVLGHGHFCGELSILEKRKHEANALAIEDTVVFLLSKEEFERIESEDPALATIFLKNLSHALSKKLRSMNERFLNLLINY